MAIHTYIPTYESRISSSTTYPALLKAYKQRISATNLHGNRVIVLHHNWRLIYDVASGFIGLVLLLAFFAFPETAFIRSNVLVEGSGETEQAETSSSRLDPALDVEKGGLEETETNKIQPGAAAAAAAAGSTSRRIINNGIHKKSYLEHLKLFSGTYTSEPFYTILLRPLGLICLPPVLWSALVQSVTIGFLVAVTSNVELAFSTSYNFRPWQVGLCFLSAVVGSIVGIPAGGQLGDWVADYLTKRNGGIREPEMRLPAMVPSLIMTPLALVLYGVGIGKRLHWMCPTVGLGLCECFTRHDTLLLFLSAQQLDDLKNVRWVSLILMFV